MIRMTSSGLDLDRSSLFKDCEGTTSNGSSARWRSLCSVEYNLVAIFAALTPALQVKSLILGRVSCVSRIILVRPRRAGCGNAEVSLRHAFIGSCTCLQIIGFG